jgi:hypothetical protein
MKRFAHWPTILVDLAYAEGRARAFLIGPAPKAKSPQGCIRNPDLPRSWWGKIVNKRLGQKSAWHITVSLGQHILILGNRR